MRDWPSKRLGDVVDIRVSNVDKKTVTGESPVRLCNYMDVYANDYIRRDLPFMSASATAAEIARFKVERGDVLLTKDSESPDDIGIAAVVDDDIDGLVCGYHLAQLKPRLDHIDPAFLAKQLNSSNAARYFAQRATGSTRYGLSNGTLAGFTFPLPPLAHQQAIAAVLRSVDNAISKTEDLIAKYQQIKVGLMHDLFTRGVLPNGQLRPRLCEAPELYKETAIGWIPRDWGVATLNEKVNPARPIVYGILMPGYGYPGGVPVVKVKDIRGRSIDVDNLLLTSPAIDQEYRRSRLKGGDILFTIRGTVGRVSLVPAILENANITQDTARIDLSGVSNAFMSLYLESAAAKRFFEINTLGVAVQGINLGELRKLPIPVPSEEEQEAIATRLLCCLDCIERELARKRKLEAQRLGLMQDLLTSRISVEHLVPEFANA